MLEQTAAQWKGRYIALGESRGEARMAQNLALDALAEHFGGASEAVRERLEAVGDAEVLRRLARGAWRAQSPEEFLALLDEAAGPAN